MTGPATQSARISLRGVAKTWESPDRRFTVSVPDMTLAPGEVALLTGESGTGKSTLLEMLGLVSEPDAGQVFTLTHAQGSADIAALWRAGDQRGLAALRAMAIGFIVQTGALIPFLPVVENITLPARMAGRPVPDTAWLISALELGGLEGQYPANLSIGQRQRTAIARAVAHRPGLILADEPTAALDPDNKQRAVRLLLSLAAEVGATVIIASHETALVQQTGLRRLRLIMTADGSADGHAVSTLTEGTRPC